MPKRLLNLKINRVALVDEGDDPDAQIVFWKRKADAGDMDPAQSDGTDTAGQATATDKSKQQNQNSNAGRDGKLMADQTTLTQEQLDEIQKQRDNAQAELEKAKKELDDLKAKAKADKTDMQKRMDDLEKRAKEDAEEVAKMQDERRTADALKIVGGWDFIVPGNEVTEYAEVVKKLRASAPGQFDKVQKLIDDANAKLKAFEDQKVIGKDTEGPTDAEQRIETVAVELMKTHPDWTIAKARTEAWERNPELYNEHVKAQKEGR